VTKIQPACGCVWIVWVICAAKSAKVARGSNAGSHKLSGRDVQVGDQTLRAMPLVFEFLSLNMTGQHGQGWMEPLKSLNAGHLIGTPHMGTLRRKHGSCLGDFTHRTDLLAQFSGVIWRGSKPISLAMGLESAHLLKSAPRCGEKSSSRCPV